MTTRARNQFGMAMRILGNPLGDGVDFQSGIPWPSFPPPDGVMLGSGGNWPLGISRSALAEAWFEGKKFKIESPGAAWQATTDQLFNSFSGFSESANPFPWVQGSFAFPLTYGLGIDLDPPDLDFSGLSIELDSVFSNDPEDDEYFPLLQFNALDVDGFTTIGTINATDVSLPTIGTYRFMGFECPIYSNSPDDPVDYGDVNITIDTRW